MFSIRRFKWGCINIENVIFFRWKHWWLVHYVKPLNLPSGQTLVVKMFWKDTLIESWSNPNITQATDKSYIVFKEMRLNDWIKFENQMYKTWIIQIYAYMYPSIELLIFNWSFFFQVIFPSINLLNVKYWYIFECTYYTHTCCYQSAMLWWSSKL